MKYIFILFLSVLPIYSGINAQEITEKAMNAEMQEQQIRSFLNSYLAVRTVSESSLFSIETLSTCESDHDVGQHPCYPHCLDFYGL